MMRTIEKVRLVLGAMLLAGVLHALVGAPKLAPLNQDHPPKHASTSRGTYEVHALQAASLPAGFPAPRPHYE